ncbi:MAG: antiviral reverse transcriptase Drt3b [Bacteroidota bacterium]
MKRQKTSIKYTKERVVLSDILPFEIPLTFSNRYFYTFLVKHNIKITNENGKPSKITWDSNEPFVGDILKLLFGFKQDKTIINNEIKIDLKKELRKIPFNFKISHKENDYRELTIIHPGSQLALIDFYDNYRDLILYYSNISNFSIRKAGKVAKYIYQKPKTRKKEFGKLIEDDLIQESETKYANLKHYFHYSNYSNIHKFYESYQYHQCEKKYNKLCKFDISKCFDSIYTHSISWALLNKEIVKDNIPSCECTFAGKFDKLMQNLNYGETNGIVIGPEFSRIFAELILQQIDKNVYLKLKEHGKIHKKHFEIFRYVDDFFVFYNDDKIRDDIFGLYRLELKEYKLCFNDSKSKLYEKPIITELSIAKQKISDLLNKDLAFTINALDHTVQIGDDTQDGEEGGQEDHSEEKKESKYKIYVSSNKLITRFKTIVKETKIEYKDILNYALASIDKKIEKLVKIYDESENSVIKEKAFASTFLQILDFTFFLYSVSPRVNSTIKLCMIVNKITAFINRNNKDKTDTFSFDNKHRVFKKISDEISQVLNKNKSNEHIQVETLYLLIALRELGREYRLDKNTLCEYFNIHHTDGKYKIGSLNYFSLTVLLFYIKDAERYKLLRYDIMNHIKKMFKAQGKDNSAKKAEMVFLLLDILTCPYVDDLSKKKKEEKYKYKKELLSLMGVQEANHIGIIEMENFWFTKWTDFQFGAELESKKSQEVYG